MRDDSVLNTGASSAAFGSTKEAQKQAEKRQEVAEEKEGRKQQLKPHEQLIKDAIKKELAAIRNLDTVNVDQSGETLKAEMMGREIAKQRILSFQTSILNDLRSK